MRRDNIYCLCQIISPCHIVSRPHCEVLNCMADQLPVSSQLNKYSHANIPRVTLSKVTPLVSKQEQGDRSQLFTGAVTRVCYGQLMCRVR